MPEANKLAASQAVGNEKSAPSPATTSQAEGNEKTSLPPATDTVEGLQKEREALLLEVDVAKEALEKATQQLTDLETRADVLRSMTAIQTVTETGEYRFAKDLITRDIKRLEIAYADLRTLLLIIQDRQEQLYSELTKADRTLKTEFVEADINLDKLLQKHAEEADSKTERLKRESDQALAALQKHTDEAASNLKAELTGLVNGVQKSLTKEVSTVQADFTDRVNSVQADLTNQIKDLEASGTERGVNTDNTIRGIQEEFSRLNMDLNGLTTRIDNDLVQLQNKIGNEIKNEVDRLKGELTQQLNKVNMDTQNLKTNKESSLRTLAQYVNRLATVVGKTQDLTRFGLDNAMKKLENTGSM